MNNILADRAQVDQEDPQQLMGLTYARDTMFTINSEAIEAHKAVLDARTDLNTAKGWVGDCLIVTMGPQGELRLKITGVSAGQVSWADVRFDGTVLPGAARNFGMAEGMPVEVWKRSDGVLTVSSNHNEIYRTYSWTGKLQSYAMYQASTRVSEGLGQHITMDATKRNRGPAIPLNDETFEETQQRKVHAASGTRALGYDRSIGPARSPVNIEDEDLGWDINVAPYRRLGGDTIFQEAQGYRSGRYDNHIMPAHMVDVNDTDWYLQQQEDKPNRFVGGRSNSTQLYLQSATVLYHQGKLSISDAMDVMAFVIADMVVSGEHSMPECMTTLVMAAGTTEPWDKTPMNLEGPKQTMHAWLRLVNSSTKANMKADAENALWRMLADPDHDRRLVRLLGIIRREF